MAKRAATSIATDEELESRLRRLAEFQGRSPESVMRETIQEFLARAETQHARWQETLRALEAYEATGVHASADEVHRWLASWGTAGELPVPTCHP